MSDATNEALARRFYDAFYSRNLDAFDEFMTEDFTDHNPAPGQGPGLAGVKAGIGMYLAAFSDMKLEPQLVIAKDDYVTVTQSGAGTHDGEFLGNAATGNSVSFDSIDLWLPDICPASGDCSKMPGSGAAVSSGLRLVTEAHCR